MNTSDNESIKLSPKTVTTFQEAIKRLQQFGEELEGLDSRFGTLTQRVQSVTFHHQGTHKQRDTNQVLPSSHIEGDSQGGLLPPTIFARTPSNLRNHLIQQVQRMNDAIVQKVREQMNIQFSHMQEEILAIQTTPLDMRTLGSPSHVINRQDVTGPLSQPSFQENLHGKLAESVLDAIILSMFEGGRSGPPTSDSQKGGERSGQGRARSLLSSLLQLGRFAVRRIGPLGLMLAAGELVTSVTENASMTDTQKELRAAEFHQIAAENHLNDQPKDGLAIVTNLFTKLRLASGSIANGFNTFMGMEPRHHGLFDQIAFDNEYKSWMRENYGSTIYQEKVANGRALVGNQVRTSEDFMTEFLQATGRADHLSLAQTTEYSERILQQRTAEEDEERRRRKSEERVKQLERLRVLQDDNLYYTNPFLKSELKERTDVHHRERNVEELDAVLSGIKTTSREYIELQNERIRGELRIQEEVIGGLEHFVRMQQEKLRELEQLGKKYVFDPFLGKHRVSEEYRLTKESVDTYEGNLASLQNEYAQQRKEAQLKVAENETRAALASFNDSIDSIEFHKKMKDFHFALSMDRQSPEYVQARIGSERSYISQVSNELERLRGQDLLDPNDMLKARIRSLEEQLASTEVSIKDLRLQEVTAYRRDLEKFEVGQEIEYLQAQLQAGTTDVSNPLLRNIQRTQGAQRINELEVYMANLQSQQVEATNAQDFERVGLIQDELLQLEKASLRVQVGMLDELRGTGGTFNLPEGLRVMTEYDWFSAQGTHSQYTIGAGDLNVNLTLPNITNATSAEQMQVIAESIALGMMSGRMGAMRQQMAGGPWGYRSI